MENYVFFLHNILLADFGDQLTIVENIFHVYSLEIFTIKRLSCDDESAQLTLL